MKQVRVVRNQSISNQIETFSSGHVIESEQSTTLAFEKRNRLEKRSVELIEAVRALDTATDAAYRQELIEWIKNAYAERMGGALFAIFSKCYLGEPYVDHHLSIAGEIMEHYQRSDTIPAIFSQARALAKSSAYAYIEIYSDGQIVPVARDGSAR